MRTPLVTVLGCLVGTLALAEPPRGAGDAPRLTLEQALDRARAVAKDKKLDLSRQYLEAVVFDRRGASPSAFGRCWEARWQVPNAKGGSTHIYVCEDDRVEVRRGE